MGDLSQFQGSGMSNRQNMWCGNCRKDVSVVVGLNQCPVCHRPLKGPYGPEKEKGLWSRDGMSY